MADTRPTVLVTGATGFLGRRVVERFARDGFPVVAGSRSAARLADEFPTGVRAVALDVTDAASACSAVEGVDIVVHAAAKLGDWGRRHDYVKVLRDGTKNLLDAVVDRPLLRFVHVSSTIFYGTTGRGIMTEGMLPGHSPFAYGEGKIAAEHEVKSAREAHRVPTVILRPANIFGPGSPLWTDRPAELIQRGLMSLPRDHGKANLVYVDNVVEAIRLVCENDAAVGETFNVVDDDQLGWADLFGAYAAGLGRGPVAIREPWVLYGLAATLETLARVTGRPPLLTRDAVTYLRFGGTYARGKLAERLGYQPAVGFEDSLARTVDYLKQRG